MQTLTTLDSPTTDALRQALADKHRQLGQLDRLSTATRTTTARNYDSAIKNLGSFMETAGAVLPTRSILEAWRDEMSVSYAIRTVNARLAAARKLLRGVADDVTNIELKLVLRDWAQVADVKATAVQDKTEEDYGLRLTLGQLERLVNAPGVDTIKGLRDRALIAVMAGAGLRVSEAAALSVRDVFLTTNEHGQRGIRVRRGKHNKSRIVVLGDWNSWVLVAVQAYTDALGLLALATPDVHIFRGVKRLRNGAYLSLPDKLSDRGAQRAVEAYTVDGLKVNAHDLRRTYAKLCKDAGMGWEALRENMGHSSVKITEDYVGHDVDWAERIPNWRVKLEG